MTITARPGKVLTIAYCEGGCGLGVDWSVWPEHLKRDGTYECGDPKCRLEALAKKAGYPSTADVYGEALA